MNKSNQKKLETKSPSHYLEKIIYSDITKLKPYSNNARIHSSKQIEQIARSITSFGFTNPILVDDNNEIIAGHGRYLAAQLLKLQSVPTIRLQHLSDKQKKAYILADNKLAEKAGWDRETLKIELQNIVEIDLDFDLTLTGFETPELDLIFHEDTLTSTPETYDEPDELEIKRQVQFGDLWALGDHLLYCGDSTKAESFGKLLGKEKANVVFTDPPYNVRINGHVSGKGKTKHSEFEYASGDMSDKEFKEFLNVTLSHMKDFSVDGSLHYICMDWRHIEELIAVGKSLYTDLKNICVWNKQIGAMGSLYRSQHEFIALFKNGSRAHTNNIELGKHGRYRTNIWDYPGVQATNHNKKDLKYHPTVKPVLMIADALLDSSKIGDVVLDCFGGSGSTLLAAERTKRKARIIEYEPKYCDVTIHRFEAETGKTATLMYREENNHAA